MITPTERPMHTPGLIIEQAGQTREAFSYDRPLMETTNHALLEYARATYGPDAIVRPMSEQEEHDFIRHGPEFFRRVTQL